jgi:DNA-binding NarL/FixJ family response regulator
MKEQNVKMDSAITKLPWSKVLVASDQPILRFGLLRLISQESDIEVRGEAESCPELLLKTEELGPDMVVVSLPLGGRLHPGWLGQLKHKQPSLKILAGIRVNDSSLACRVIRAGADGCVHWGASATEVITAIRKVLGGELYLGNTAWKQLLQEAAGDQPAGADVIESLTDREAEIFAMIGQGMNTKHIARALDLSPRTVDSHRKKLKLKLRLPTSAELNCRAFQYWQENSSLRTQCQQIRHC